MPTTNYPLKDGSTLVVTETSKEVVSTELVEKKTQYTETTSKIIPGPGPTPPNKLPLVAAGIDQQIKLPLSEVTLNGVVSDSDGTVAKTVWTKVGGAGTISTPNALSTKVIGMTVGDYLFRLTATDDKGGVTADDLNVKVLAADPNPIPIGKYLSLPISGIRDISGQSNVVIENLQFKNTSAACIKAFGSSNVTIRNCFFNGSAKEAIDLNGSFNITVINCLFARVECGVYALNCQTIKINNNQFVNVRQRRDNDGKSRGQFVQFNSCGGSGNEIMNNKGENFNGESDPEDLISMYRSSGTAASPTIISGNMFRGGGPSDSGGGIIAGDNGGGNTIIENNVLLNPGQYGLSIAGGSNIIIRNNKVFSKQFPWSNNPLYMWAQAGAGCSNNTVINNRASWTDKNGNKNGGWDAGNCGGSAFQYPTEIEEAQLNVPAHLIDFVTPEELLTIRK